MDTSLIRGGPETPAVRRGHLPREGRSSVPSAGTANNDSRPALFGRLLSGCPSPTLSLDHWTTRPLPRRRPRRDSIRELQYRRAQAVALGPSFRSFLRCAAHPRRFAPSGGISQRPNDGRPALTGRLRSSNLVSVLSGSSRLCVGDFGSFARFFSVRVVARSWSAPSNVSTLRPEAHTLAVG